MITHARCVFIAVIRYYIVYWKSVQNSEKFNYQSLLFCNIYQYCFSTTLLLLYCLSFYISSTVWNVPPHLHRKEPLLGSALNMLPPIPDLPNPSISWPTMWLWFISTDRQWCLLLRLYNDDPVTLQCWWDVIEWRCDISVVTASAVSGDYRALC